MVARTRFSMYRRLLSRYFLQYLTAEKSQPYLELIPRFPAFVPGQNLRLVIGTAHIGRATHLLWQAYFLYALPIPLWVICCRCYRLYKYSFIPPSVIVMVAKSISLPCHVNRSTAAWLSRFGWILLGHPVILGRSSSAYDYLAHLQLNRQLICDTAYIQSPLLLLSYKQFRFI